VALARGAVRCARLACALGTPMVTPGSSWRRRAAPLLLLAAGLGAFLMLGRALPHDQDVALDLGSGARDVTSVEIAWSRPGSKEDPALSTRYNFAQGNAPRRLQARVRLSNGPWIADVEVARADVARPMHWSRLVDLNGDPMTLPLHEALR
jgi:hypothetical protein